MQTNDLIELAFDWQEHCAEHGVPSGMDSLTAYNLFKADRLSARSIEEAGA